MIKKAYLESTAYKYFPFVMLSLLFIAALASLYQAEKPQSYQGEAQVVPTTVLQNCTVSEADMAIQPEEQSVFDKVNAYRVEKGLTQLAWSSELKRAAEWMSKDLSTRALLSHTDSLTRNPTTRLTNCGYPTGVSTGEDLGSGPPNPEEIVSAWKSSATHNAILIDPRFTQAAVGMVPATSGAQVYWTLNLGAASVSATPTIPITSTVEPSSEPTVTNAPTGSTITTAPPTEDPMLPSPIPTDGPSPTPHPEFKVNVDDTQLFVSAQVSGLGEGGNTTPKNLTRKVDVEIYSLDNDVVYTGSGFLKYDGTNLFEGIIHLGKVVNGTYYIKVLGQNMLKTEVLPRFQQLSNFRLNTLPQIILRQGDMDNDNALTTADYGLIITCFNDSLCDTRSQIDFNDDGTVNIADYNIILDSLGTYTGD